MVDAACCNTEAGLPVASYEDYTDRLWSSCIGMEPRRLLLHCRVTSASNTFYVKANENSIIVNNKKWKSFTYPLVQNGGN